MSDCHRRIEMFLNALRAVGNFDGRQLTEDVRRTLDAALRYFREAAPKHNADEEESLFPRLRSVPHPEVRAALADLARLEEEHHWAAPLHAEVDRLGQQWLLEGRLTRGHARAFQSAVGKLESMYRTHIQFKDRVLFPLAALVLSPAQSAEIAQEMAKRRSLSSFAVQELQPRDDGGSRTFGSSEINSESCSGHKMSATRASDLLRSEHRLVETQIDQLLHAVKHPAGDIVSDGRRALCGTSGKSRDACRSRS